MQLHIILTSALRVDYADPTATIKLGVHIKFDSTTEPGQTLDFISNLLIGTNREIGDINGDSRVDVLDMTIMCIDWMEGNSLADIAPKPDGDGVVNIKDFAVLAENWMITLDN